MTAVRDRSGRFAPTRPRPAGMTDADVRAIELHDKIVAGQIRARALDSYADRGFAGTGVIPCKLCGRPCRDHKLTDPIGTCIGVRP